MLLSYNPKLARAFAEIALNTIATGLSAVEDHQVVAYISRVSMELSIKALLEKAGVPRKTVRALSHDLPDLLRELDKCKVKMADIPIPVSAMRVRGKEILWNGALVTLGNVIDAEHAGASNFPDQYRYGPPPTDYQAEVLAHAAVALCTWAEEHWDSIAC